MKNVITEEVNNQENSKSTAGDDSDSNDFFARPSTTCDSKSMLMDWLSRLASEHLSTEEFTAFKALLPLFVATNTGLPSSAAVERLSALPGVFFSQRGQP